MENGTCASISSTTNRVFIDSAVLTELSSLWSEACLHNLILVCRKKNSDLDYAGIKKLKCKYKEKN